MRGLGFDDFTFLKRSEKRIGRRVRLWKTTKGSHVALYPNLNANDRPAGAACCATLASGAPSRSRSIGARINLILYRGFAVQGNNTVDESSPLFRPELRERWGGFDLARANRLLDEMGLVGREPGTGLRRLPDGRPLVIVVETAGETSEQADILELVHDTWLKAGIKLYTKPLQRETFRNRVFAGETLMSVWGGLENGTPGPASSPAELAPTSQQQLQWPKWGQHHQNRGRTGEPCDGPYATELLALYGEWIEALVPGRRVAIWRRMLDIHADQVYSIGIVAAIPQPVVVNARLRNVPERGVYNWEPGAQPRHPPHGHLLVRAPMIRYLAHRLLVMIPTLAIISGLVFVIIQLPEGDFLTSQIAELEAQGETVNRERIEFLRSEYGLDPSPRRAVPCGGSRGCSRATSAIRSSHRLPVNEVVGDRLFLTFLVSFATIVFTWLVSFPIGVYSATHQYSAGDHALTFLGFIGLATPNFLLALVLLYFANVHFGTSIGGLMDPEYLGEPMSWRKFVSVLEHLWIPVVVIGTSGTAGMIRRLRANLLDELGKQYVVTARAKGMPRMRLLLKYPPADGPQPLRRGHREPPAASGVGGGGGGGGALAPDHRADADRRAPQPGHVPRGVVPHVPRGADGRRHVPLRCGPRRPRPPHPLRGGAEMSRAAPRRLPPFARGTGGRVAAAGPRPPGRGVRSDERRRTARHPRRTAGGGALRLPRALRPPIPSRPCPRSRSATSSHRNGE